MIDMLASIKDTIIDPLIVVGVGIYFSIVLWDIYSASRKEYKDVARGGREGVSRIRLFWQIFFDNASGMLSNGALAAAVIVLILELDEIVIWVRDIWEDLKATAFLMPTWNLAMHMPLVGMLVQLPAASIQRVRAQIVRIRNHLRHIK